MDLIRRARRWALRQPRVLLVAAPDEQRARWTVEAELDRRGWPLAMSPADTDLLIVVGHPGPQLSEAVEVLWSQVPWPRHRISWDSHVALPEALDTAAQELADVAEHGPREDSHRPDPQTLLSARADGPASGANTADHGHGSDDGSGGRKGSDHGDGHDMAHGGEDDGKHAAHDQHHGQHGEHTQPHAAQDESSGHGPHASDGEPGGHEQHAEDAGHGQHAGHGEHREQGEQGGGATHEGMDHGGMEHAGMDHGGMDHGGMDHGGHGGHGGMDVAGLPMADTAPDRDGLELDQLKVSLGPVLPGWPTGLVLEAGLQGDVLSGVELRWLDEQNSDPHLAETEELTLRVALDVLARFLLVAGWPRAARATRQARDGVGSADPVEVAAARRNGAGLARRIGRSRTLAWTLRGLGDLQGTDGQETDLLDCIRSWCEIAAGDSNAKIPTPSLSDLAAGLEGAELGAARLVIASLGLPHAVSRPHEVAGV